MKLLSILTTLIFICSPLIAGGTGPRALKDICLQTISCSLREHRLPGQKGDITKTIVRTPQSLEIQTKQIDLSDRTIAPLELRVQVVLEAQCPDLNSLLALFGEVLDDFFQEQLQNKIIQQISRASNFLLDLSYEFTGNSRIDEDGIIHYELRDQSKFPFKKFQERMATLDTKYHQTLKTILINHDQEFKDAISMMSEDIPQEILENLSIEQLLFLKLIRLRGFIYSNDLAPAQPLIRTFPPEIQKIFTDLPHFPYFRHFYNKSLEIAEPLLISALIGTYSYLAYKYYREGGTFPDFGNQMNTSFALIGKAITKQGKTALSLTTLLTQKILGRTPR